ncbi:MAG: hypothetical protein IJ228_02595 [Succinivibrio sp.]|nr:hypothetical protein [Succinivibrio sp.]
MIEILKGLGANIEEALSRLPEQVEQPRLAIFFSADHDVQSGALKVAARFPDIPTLGLYSIDVLHADDSLDARAAVVVLCRDFWISAGVITDLSECPVQHILRFENAAKRVMADDLSTVCLEYCTGHEGQLVTTLNAVLENYGTPLMGSTVLDLEDPEGNVVAFNGKIYKNACVYALIRNLCGPIHVYCENIYDRDDDRELYQITKMDRPKQILWEIDGKPAADVYCNALGLKNYEDILTAITYYPLGRIIGDNFYVGSVRQVTPDGGVVCAKVFNVNDAISILNCRNFRAKAEQTVKRVLEENPQRIFTLTGDCYHRYLLYRAEDFMGQHIANLHRYGEHAGNICGGEQYRLQHVNHSLVMAVFNAE